MKRLVHILVLACLMAACTSPVETRHGASLPTDDMHPRLAAIDSLMWQQPDSALAVLLDFAGSPLADSLDAFDGHYCQMLVSELLYKNDCEQSNRTELLRAVDYFDSLCISGDVPWRVSTDNVVFLDARAHYINGVGFYERDSIVEACEEYLKALEMMENHFEEKELMEKKARFMVGIYNRLGDLFSAQFMMEDAIACYEQALSYCLIETTSPCGVSNVLYHIGMQYDKKENLSKARQYYGQALETVSNIDNLTYRNIVASKALCDYQIEKKPELPLNALRKIIGQAENEEERLTRYLTVGAIYFEEKMLDSAFFYLKSVYENTDDVSVRIQVASYLRVIYENAGEQEKADECVRFMAGNMKSEGENKVLVSQLDKLFQEYLKQKQKKLTEAEHTKHINNNVGIIVPVAVFVALGIIVVAQRRSRKLLKKQQEEADRVMTSKEMEHKRKLEFERQTHQMQQAALSGRLKQSNETLRELKMQVAKQKEEAASQTEQAATFAEEPICRLIMGRVNEGQFKSKVDYKEYKDYALNKNQLLSLREAADRHFGQFTVRLKQAYPKLTNGDLDYCCLYLLGLSDADIAALMQRAYNTVTERSAKLRNAFGVENNISDTLRGLAASFLPS